MSGDPRRQNPARAFRMPIDHIRSMTGRGTLVTGTIQQGVVKAGDSVEIIGPDVSRSSVVLAVEMAGKVVGHAGAGDTVGVLLRGVDLEEIASGQVLRAL